ncbi:MAG: monovalent cation/H+ antiporter subunit D family protein [Clostridia bacterium]|nr:monovalent cation/H+ antiporter subunit D family protein [Clostridia bacterium]
MEIIMDYRPLWAVLVSIIVSPLIFLNDKNENYREAWSILASTVKIGIVFSMLPAVLSGKVLEVKPFSIAQGIEFHLRADTFGMIFAVLASFLWLITTFYSMGYMRGGKYQYQTGYFAAFALSLSATMGIAFAGNLLTFFIFFELLTLATYPLVIHGRQKKDIAAGRKYLAYTLIAGQVMFVGILWVYSLTSTLEFVPGGFLAGSASWDILRMIFILLIVGTSVKAAVMPLHEWLPTAMVAPTPVSALLHAVAVVKAGAFGVIRIVGYVFGPELMVDMGAADVLAWFAAATIIFSSFVAMRQDNLKRRLAFSTVGQLSYCVLGAALASPLAIQGGMFHIAAHAFMKITLFFCAGAIFITTGKEYISDMRGIGRQMPITMGAFTIASFGIVGLPLIVGFISKWNLALGALQTGKALYIVILVASAMLSAVYLLPIGFMAFFKENDEFSGYGEARLDMLVPIVVVVFISVVLGVMPNFGVKFFDLASMSSSQILEDSVKLLGGWR